MEIKEMEWTLDNTEERQACVSPAMEGYQELPAPKMSITSTSAMSLTPSTTVYSSILFQDKAGLCCRLPKSFNSSSDEDKSSGNSDIPESSLWRLWDRRLPRYLKATHFHSCSFNSQDEFSDTLDCDDKVVGDLGVDGECFGVDVSSGDRGQGEILQRQAARVCAKVRPDPNPLLPVPLLCHQESTCHLADTPTHITPLYVPQFQTASFLESQRENTRLGF